ncbi:DUF1800 family protein [Siculibacillus lacustris]|uniref:DUF1800 family protein n=1 Tax=Siculibacillus lacustris TaxID=1549641 RepID=A0A4Q9VWR0_9HYPH|nr:DUF1800 family protein [Siculibacillus lacustris]TBW40341.1 DUF1800 family protein [Siculibacillus lacustris]
MAASPDARAALIALNRFGYGARPGDLAAAASDPRGFLAEELARPGIARIDADLPGSAAALASLFEDQDRVRLEREAAARPAVAAPPAGAPPAGAPVAAGMAAAPQAGAMAPAMAAPPTAGATPPAMADAKPKPPPGPSLETRLYRAEAQARFAKAIEAPAGFVERLVAFWSNHFAVSVSKDQFVRVGAGPFEREAIRPHVLGRFADMLAAVERHPAMLVFLDNQQSTGPNSKAGRSNHRGLNENLAREILELHTLGVDAPYRQDDVTALARIITGWTHTPRDGKAGPPGTFLFRPEWHEPGAHALLGTTYPEGGVEQGLAALADLARHPATAHHLAVKLVRHFVADAPPPALVDTIAATFRDGDGDLARVARALIESDAAWEAPTTKIRSPIEFLVAMARATGLGPPDPGRLLGQLEALGQPLWQPAGPNGFADGTAVWASPEAMKLRLDLAWAVAQRAADYGPPLGVLDTVAGLAASRDTRETMARAESRPQALAILFMSPEFQRR